MALKAYIDESGTRSHSQNASKHFVMSAVVIDDSAAADVTGALARLRLDLGRMPGDELHFINLKKPRALRLHAAHAVGLMPVTVMSAVVCKRHLSPVELSSEDDLYLVALRLLLERLSWFGQSRGLVVECTLAHVVRFKASTLSDYESQLRSTSTDIEWAFLSPHGIRLDQPIRVEELQIADIVASATFHAFETDGRGETEDRYLAELRSSLYRSDSDGNELTLVGLKIHPWLEARRPHTRGWRPSDRRSA